MMFWFCTSFSSRRLLTCEIAAQTRVQTSPKLVR